MQQVKERTIYLLNDLSKYGLLWDKGNGYISTCCPTIKISNTICSILKSNDIHAHQMTTDKRIIVIYIVN